MEYCHCVIAYALTVAHPSLAGAPFIGAAVVMGVSLVIVFTINAKAADNGKFLAKSLDDASAPLLNPGGLYGTKCHKPLRPVLLQA